MTVKESKTRVTLSVDKNLINQADELAKKYNLSRSGLFTVLSQQALEQGTIFLNKN